MLTTKGLSHDTREPGEPLIDTMPSSAVRRELRAALDCALESATPRGRAHVGWPSSADAIASRCGVAKRHGVGATQEAHRMALRLPAFCGVPTRAEAEQGLQVRVARPPELTAPCPSLTKPRREVLGQPERLERLSLDQATPHVARIPRPKSRSHYQAIIHISTGDEECHGPPWPSPGGLHCLENAGPPGIKETALTSCIQKPVNAFGPKMAFLDTLG